MRRRLGRFPGDVFLAALYPVLALLAANVGQLTPTDALRSLLVAELLALLLLLVWRGLLRSWGKAGVMSLLSLFLLFSYGHIYSAVEDTVVAGVLVGRHRFLLGASLALLASAFVLLLRARADLARWTPGLTALTLILVLLPAAQLAWSGWQGGGQQGGAPAAHPEGLLAVANAPPPDALPDIYYIVLDMYTRQDVLADVMQLDTQGFLSQLESMGFYVAECSRSNYANTVLSLASSLNADYLEAFGSELIESDSNRYTFARYIQDSQVVADLRRLGYEIVAFESGFTSTELSGADVYLAPSRDPRYLLTGGLNEFESLLLKTSVGLFLYETDPDSLSYALRTNLYDRPYVEHRDRILFAFEGLPEVAQRPGPKFVFVHILAPHGPFVFNADGTFVERKTPFALNDDREVQKWSTYASGYSGQVEFLNRRLLEIVPEILAASPAPPVILIQGDHGIPRLPDRTQRVDILSAYLLPGDGREKLYASISPVNSFRLIAEAYFGGLLPLLPDRSYLAKGGSLVFEEVAEGNPECAP